LSRYSWPGNVRELRNAMERASLLCRGELILAEHLPARIRPPSGPPVSMDEDAVHHLEEIEYQAVLQTLRKQDFNRTTTARALGISRRALIYKLQRMRERGFDVDRAPGLQPRGGFAGP
jgi:DNA-binding NtrC family response regulator